MNLLRLLFAALVVGLSAGCATPVVDAQVKSSIRTISMEPIPALNKPIVALPGAGAAALLGGPIGLGALQSSGSDVQLAYKAILERNVDVPAEITRHLKAQLQQKGYVVVGPGERADAKLVTNASYGLGLTSLFGDERAVTTNIFIQLVRTSDGQMLYRTQNFTGSNKALLTKLKTAPFAKWFEDGALVAEQHKLVAELVATEVVSGF
jgi:hypothetical protein